MGDVPRILYYALSHERLLRVELRGRPRVNDANTDSHHGPPNACKTSARYLIVLLGRKLISKLFHINSESRYIALRFYRVHLPCEYHWHGRVENGTFYFNPEFDTLRLHSTNMDRFVHSGLAGSSSDWKYFAKFAYDLWAHDRRRVGLVNLALRTTMFLRPDFGRLLARQKDMHLLRGVLSRMRRVIFVCPGGPSRMSFGPLSGGPSTQKCELHRSRPVMASITSFDRLPYDPRPIDLKGVYMGVSSSQKLIYGWFRMLERLQVEHSHEVDYRCLVAHEEAWVKITDRDDAKSWIIAEDEKWRDGLQKKRGRGYSGLYAREKTPEELERAPQPAIGFWLFPMTALGPYFDDDLACRVQLWAPHKVLDMSEYKPELCLFHLG